MDTQVDVRLQSIRKTTWSPVVFVGMKKEENEYRGMLKESLEPEMFEFNCAEIMMRYLKRIAKRSHFVDPKRFDNPPDFDFHTPCDEAYLVFVLELLYNRNNTIQGACSHKGGKYFFRNEEELSAIIQDSFAKMYGA